MIIRKCRVHAYHTEGKIYRKSNLKLIFRNIYATSYFQWPCYVHFAPAFFASLSSYLVQTWTRGDGLKLFDRSQGFFFHSKAMNEITVLQIITFFLRYTHLHLLTYKLVRKLFGINIYIFLS